MKIAIDHADRRILAAVQKDGRISLTDLAEQVGLSATPCKRRLARLEDSGVIAGYQARIDPVASGFGITVFVSVELERQQVAELSRFQQAVAGFDEVVTGTLMTGSQDFLLEVAVESLEEYERFLQTRLLKVEGIRAVRSRFALRKFIDRARIP
ncbi:Lrp/AsnC family transcriptional regulator [Paracoccus marinaquae]|uniref:Lrp/AsnC family transcriptional regulator n=1 Tax=Paracoccus marinaquae TaxID=2841926 RepID=A0ABS6AHP0_9RHOB|nr:Lrp/AsnC family transcriptional regulator [Paracoccus marinaquae]MBU3030034.1 Lrp/AsnC family transcriptional regulator [Paracoccus marinaquae]